MTPQEKLIQNLLSKPGEGPSVSSELFAFEMEGNPQMQPMGQGMPSPQGQLMGKIAKEMPHFTDQDRPEGVKKIYRALKREHPGMPAEMKARIAARQGKPGKQHQGPPYKAPIHSTYQGD